MRIFGLEINRAKRRKELRSAPTTADQLRLQFGTYSGLSPTFSTFSNYKESEAYMSALRTNAAYCSKIALSAVRIDKNGMIVHDAQNVKLDKLLQHRPNPTTNASTFWERVAFFYYHYNNAFIYKEEDMFGEAVALWAPDPADIQFIKLQETGEIILRFVINGKTVEYPYDCMIHIANTVVNNSMFGEQNSSLKRVLQVIDTNYQGIEKAIVNSAFIRFVITCASKISDEKREKLAKDFTDNYLKVRGDGDGIAAIVADSAYEYKELNGNTAKTANYAEMKQFNESVYKYMGCPEDVIAGKADENAMIAYYGRTPSVFFARLAEELTEKLYTKGEYERGNRIIYSDQKMQYLSMATRLNIFHEAREMGIFTAGVLGDLLGLPVPNDHRDKVMISQNYSSDKGSDDNDEPDSTDDKGENDNGSSD